MFFLGDLMNYCSDITLMRFLAIIKRGLIILYIVGPILAIISITISFVKLMGNPDDKKAPKSIKNSIIALIVVFLVPFLISFTLDSLGDNFEFTACWNQIADDTVSDSGGGYIEIDNGKNKQNPFNVN